MKLLKCLLLVSICALLTVCALLPALAQIKDDPRPVVTDTAPPETAAHSNLPTLYIVGDSTLKSNAPLRGWGQELGAFFDPTKLNVVNRAIGGRSSRTFQTEGRWAKVIADLKPGDFVIVQFGHNDNGDYNNPAAKGRPSIRSEGEETAQAVNADGKTMETIHSFGWYMRKYCTDAEAKGARVILCSMVPHKDWKDGKILRAERDTFVKWTANAAKVTGAAYIDLNEISAEGLEALGPDKVAPLFGDARTHSTPSGAEFNARNVVAGLRALPGFPFDKDLSDKGRTVTPLPQFVVAPSAPVK